MATAASPLLVGPQKAKDHLMRGKLLDGKKAAEIGLVTHAIPRDQVMDEAMKPVFKGY